MKLNRTDEAIPPLMDVLRQDDRNAEAHLALGTAYLARRQYRQGIEQLETAGRLSPETSETYYQLGKAYLTLGNEAADQLRDLDPNKISLWARWLAAEIAIGRLGHIDRPSRGAVAGPNHLGKAQLA